MTNEIDPSHIAKVEDDADVFPEQMLLLPMIFEYSFIEIDEFASSAFSNSSEILARMDSLRNAISQSALSENDKEELLQLVDEEQEVITYSQSARSSVIAM